MTSLVKSYLGKDISDFPVVGISHKQATDYCKWRSERVNQKFSNKTVTYRLPSKEEWTAIFHASANDKFVPGLNKPSGKKKIQNLSDNVSEMVSEPGIAMGGNWKTGATATDNTITVASFEYDKPENWLGFRCVAVVK